MEEVEELLQGELPIVVRIALDGVRRCGREMRESNLAEDASRELIVDAVGVLKVVEPDREVSLR